MRSKAALIFYVFMMALTACDRPKTAESPTTPTDYKSQLLAFAVEPPPKLEDFTLATTSGDDFTLSQQTGKITVVYFGFTSCPDVCPLTLFELRKAYAELGKPQDKLNIVFISIDPERDTPQNIRAYLDFQGDPDFIGLYGEGEALEKAKAIFGVVAIKVDIPDSALGYSFDHTADVFIVSPAGELIARFAHGATASNYVHDLLLILQHEL